VVSAQGDRQAAPGDLERVRLLLNSWLIPNDTRTPTDRFKTYARQHRLVAADARELCQLRDDLRIVVEHPDASGKLDPWVEQLGLKPAVRAGRLVLQHQQRPAGEVLAVVLGAVIDGRWDRLKACPDCRWVFYDHTRNASKRWCLMNAGGKDGRSCGTIAKVRRHREKTRNVGTLVQAQLTAARGSQASERAEALEGSRQLRR
jgi:hypothetical protein